jgi:hypothetical protein
LALYRPFTSARYDWRTMAASSPEPSAPVSPSFSRESPSPRYRELIGLYRQMHETGDRARATPPEQTFPGYSLLQQAARVKQLLDHYESSSVLDYGSGKARQYEPMELKLSDGRSFPDIPSFWGMASLVCYDPAYPPLSRLPSEQFDGVICTDVLEHCPEEDMSWIVDEIFGFARKFVFAIVACHPAVKCLPNGENAHCTIKPIVWWKALLDEVAGRFSHVRYHIVFRTVGKDAEGNRRQSEVVLEG